MLFLHTANFMIVKTKRADSWPALWIVLGFYLLENDLDAQAAQEDFFAFAEHGWLVGSKASGTDVSAIGAA